MGSYNIGYLLGHLKVGGTQRHLYEVLRRLDRTRFVPRVYCLKRQGSMVQEIESLGVQVEDVEIGDSLMAPSSFIRLFKFARRLKANNISLLHCYLPRANFVGALAAKITRIPVVLVSKRSLSSHKGIMRFLSLSDAWADGILANSQEAWRHAVKVEGCRPEKMHMLTNGIDLDRYGQRSGNGFDGKVPVIGTVLRLEKVKGPDVFLEAAARIANEIPEARFVMIGDGSLRSSLEKRRSALGLNGRLQFLGARDDVDKILPTFSVFLLPSLVEGMSMALLEAMAAALPIVATRVGGNVNLIREGETGALVSPNDVDQMACAVIKILGDPERAKGLGERARSIVLKHHSADAMVERLQRIYQGFLQHEESWPRRSLRP